MEVIRIYWTTDVAANSHCRYDEPTMAVRPRSLSAAYADDQWSCDWPDFRTVHYQQLHRGRDCSGRLTQLVSWHPFFIEHADETGDGDMRWYALVRDIDQILINSSHFWSHYSWHQSSLLSCGHNIKLVGMNVFIAIPKTGAYLLRVSRRC